MRKQECKHCRQVFGLNQLVSVFDEVLCSSCADKRLKDVPRKDITPQNAYALTDPTICARCGADNGLDAYDSFLEMPVCSPCREHMKHYPFPLWIKAACIVIALMVGFTVYMNLRFFKARILMDRSMHTAFQEQLWEQASGDMEKASTLVPESRELNILSHYMVGIRELQSENCEKSVDHLEYCSDLPEAYQVRYLLLEARSGAAFNKKDYPGFLKFSQDLLQSDPNEPLRLAQVSSAYACIYATRGRQEDKQKALDCLAQAERIYGQSIPEEFRDYKERIFYRIETRQIITKKEYNLKKAKEER